MIMIGDLHLLIFLRLAIMFTLRGGLCKCIAEAKRRLTKMFSESRIRQDIMTVTSRSGSCPGSRYPCCVLLALSWNTTNEYPSTNKLSRAINYTNLAPNEPKRPDKNANFGPNLVVLGQKIQIFTGENKVLVPT